MDSLSHQINTRKLNLTTQAESGFRYKDDLYGILATGNDNYDKLFSPYDYGLIPHGESTASYSGWCAELGVSESQLTLESLYVNLEGGLQGPRINEVAPVVCDNLFNNHYENLNLTLPFTGGVLLVREPVGMSAFKIWDFSIVLELVFENGRLLNEFDRSSVVGHLRETIEKSFTRRYFL